ncbi:MULTISPECIES: hypothetical protein [unclassified Streptomyces]|uniref:hypothetical protein n=1 Tax=unclassified Streptomyces TaxID=2593676 RepID=UPI0022525D4D|nr:MULTISPECIES: hypothetical protein [unclassified Streptomyces]MCX5329163.1 hypothetical protein [Streptomyces sp. NBC_00140]MCX5358576.1 hypothetical protein [Streptomyces sp. NBC_00124]
MAGFLMLRLLWIVLERAGKVGVVTDFERDVAGYIRDYNRGRAEALVDALSVVACPPTLPELLRGIMGDEERFADVARRSVVHPNGFAKIVLLSASDFCLRLHVWHENGARTSEFRESVHNHRWDFAAVVLAGAYRHQEFQVCDGGSSFLRYRYQPAEDRRSFALVPHGDQPLRCVFDVHLAQGSRYSMSSRVLHRVVPDPALPAVSLVLEGPHQPTSVDVFAEHDLGRGARVPFVPLSSKALQHHLNVVAALTPGPV